MQFHYRTFRQFNIAAKFTIIYALAILIPSLSIFFISFAQSKTTLEREITRDIQWEFDNMHNQVNQDLVQSRKIAERLAYNTDLKDFLFTAYEFDASSLYRYRNIAFPIVEYAQGFLDDHFGSIKVYMANDSIPEAWVFFYSEKRLANRRWYTDLINSGETTRWIYPNDLHIESDFLDFDHVTVLTYAQKMYSTHRRYLGIITVNVYQERIFSRLSERQTENLEFFLTDDNGNNFQMDVEAAPIPMAGKTNGEILHLSRETEIPGLFLVCAADIGSELKIHLYSGYMVLLGVLIGLVILELVSYLAINRLFSRIHSMTGIMNQVAEGNFSLRIPIRSEDEIGQIAADFNIMIKKINSLVEESVQREILQKDAQLKALQFQINPHFIYNTIDTFRMRLIMEEMYDLADNLADFGKMLRYNMSEQTLNAALREEIGYVEKYIAIQSLRHNNRISLNLNITKNLENVNILKFTIQPIVENSILHGLPENPEMAMCISINVSRQENRIILKIHDTGAGMSKQTLDALHETLYHDRIFYLEKDLKSGIGLQNIQRRLQLHYGKSYGLQINSTPGEGTLVTISIPEGDSHADPDS